MTNRFSMSLLLTSITFAYPINVNAQESLESVTVNQGNVMTSVTSSGAKRTIWCNPGPCTLFSPMLHEKITGIEMGVPEVIIERLKSEQRMGKQGADTNVSNNLSKKAEALFIAAQEILKEVAEKTNDNNFMSAAKISPQQAEKSRERYKRQQADDDNQPQSVEPVGVEPVVASEPSMAKL